MGQTFLLFAMPLVLTAAAKVVVLAIRPLGHGVLLRRVFRTVVFRTRVCCPGPVRA
jgi:hypothetical protein